MFLTLYLQASERFEFLQKGLTWVKVDVHHPIYQVPISTYFIGSPCDLMERIMRDSLDSLRSKVSLRDESFLLSVLYLCDPVPMHHMTLLGNP